jgi:POT family proton-dependent oligopeptide transporter
MKKIPSDQKHTSETFIYVGARALERGAFYGVRSLLILYMIKGPLGLADFEAMKLYGWFVGCFLFVQLLGGLLGDLILGNKNAIILGGALQALGIFVLCVPSLNCLYAGMIVIALGMGLYSPNILANFGKLYLNKRQLLDGGFTLFYLAVNIGSFVGIAIVGMVGDPNYRVGFITAGIMMLVSTGIIATAKQPQMPKEIAFVASPNRRFTYTFLAIFTLGAFWAIYNYGGYGMYLVEDGIQNKMDVPMPLSSFSSTFAIITGLAAAVLWSVFYMRTWKKWGIGFAAGGIAFGILFFISDSTTPLTLPFYIIAVFVLSIAEILIAPALYSILTKNVNPKYLAIVIALSSIPSTVVNYISGNSEIMADGGYFSLLYCGLAMGYVALVVLIAGLFTKEPIAASV